MPAQSIQFYPEQKNAIVDPLGEGHLRYIIGNISELSREEITLKYAFIKNWQADSEEVKKRARHILSRILDIERLTLVPQRDKLLLSVPLKRIGDIRLLSDDALEIPLVVKLYKNGQSGDFQLKCLQTIQLAAQSPENVEEDEQTIDEMLQEGSSIPDWGDSQTGLAISAETNEKKTQYYSGIVSVDFGTTNSVVVVRDPLFAAEEIRDTLSKEQWRSLSKWMDEWLIEHLSMVLPNNKDFFIEELAQSMSGMDLPPCGSLSIDIWEELGKVDDAAREQFLRELVASFAEYSFAEDNQPVLRDLTHELYNGFERSIYFKSLESQRYFLLELDEHAGPGPISSALQIVTAPQEEHNRIEKTEIEMGARVNLLMRSAAVGDADIRQFAFSIKRYFGRNENLELVPSEAMATTVAFHPDALCLLTYQKLLARAMADIRYRARRGEFHDADQACIVVATFPTTYPASLRRKLRDLLYEIDVPEIDTRFDEGSASLLYYVWREVCADPICGMHGLMARCREDRHGRAYQNILLYDLGGGTTDIALIQLIYEEIPIFEPVDKTFSEGGCYFRITPRLLGSTGHRFIGGDLITLWLFRLVKTKLADALLSLLVDKKVDPPPYSAIADLLATLDEDLLDREQRYRPGALLEWTYSPLQNLRQYEKLNDAVIDKVVPTQFANKTEYTPNFFTLWNLTEEAKKTLGTPISNYPGSGLGREWPEEVLLDSGQLWRFLVSVHPWLEDRPIAENDIALTITQQELCLFARSPVSDSLNLAVNLAQARLKVRNATDKLDKLILAGFSCNLKVVQEQAKEIFRRKQKLFDFSLANVCFEQDLAKTSVALGACIGRYLESIRLDPSSEKTRQMLREGYDQVELVVENLFTYLACRLVYDSLVAMVIMFDYGQELDKRSYVDHKPVARTAMDDLRPVQEKHWVYRVDFDGATPLYLGLIDVEGVAIDNNFDDFRKFRERYMVGFEADAELFVRAFFLPRGPKNILARDFLAPDPEENPRLCEIIRQEGEKTILTHAISSQELFNRRVVLPAGMEMIDTIEYPDGTRHKCVLTDPLPIREIYDFYLEGICEENTEAQLAGHFRLADKNVPEVSLACDATGRLVLLFSVVYDIEIWADIDYVPQQVDAQYDPFCGQH